MGNLISSYHQFRNANNDNPSSPELCSSSSCIMSTSVKVPIIFHSQQEISLLLSTYHLNLPGNKHFRIYKNDRKTTCRHVAIFQLQRNHNIEVDSYNKQNKNTPGFISRKKEVVLGQNTRDPTGDGGVRGAAGAGPRRADVLRRAHARAGARAVCWACPVHPHRAMYAPRRSLLRA